MNFLESADLDWLLLGLSPFVGLVAGSFLNVVIHRWPDGSVLRPGSRCPACGHPIRWRDNIPLLSYLLLRGKCRDCGARISPRYPLVEFLTAGLITFAALYFVIGGPGEGLAYVQFGIAVLLSCVAVAAAGIDLRTGLILDVLTIPLIVLAFTCSLAGLTISFGQAIGGAILAGGILAATNFFWKDGMGWGDVKYAVGLGAFFGIVSSLFLVVIAALLGSLVGVALILRKKKTMRDRIPFGPYLAAASVVTLYFGPLFRRFLLP